MLCVATVALPKRELESLVTSKIIAVPVTPESGLVLEGLMTTANTCGNVSCCDGDNGDKNINAIGYIFVQ